MILEYRSNIQWDPIVQEVVVEILANAFRYCNGFMDFNLHKGRPRWTEYEWVRRRVHSLLFDENGWPLLSVYDDDYWEAVKSPEMVVAKYTNKVIDIAERLIADNTLLFNSLYYRYRIQRAEFARIVPNYIIFNIAGCKK